MSNPFALIARADRGGLASQTWEVWRHLNPARTLIVDLGEHGRGACQPAMYLNPDMDGQVRITVKGYPSEEETAWLIDDPEIKSVFTVEVLYGDANRWVLAEWGGRVVCQANPELYDESAFDGCQFILAAPTPWERDRLKGGIETIDLPVPVVLHPPRPVRSVERPRMYHPHGAAMLDRNGTKYVAGALQIARCRLEAVIPLRAPHRNRNDPVRYVQPEDAPTYEHVWDTADPDFIVIPRRYGGLSLPMQEAAARGIPIIATDLPPQNGWLHPDALVPAKHERDFPMKGGLFGIYSVQAADLAATIERFYDPEVRRQHSEHVYAYAERLSWDRWRDVYLDLLCQ